VVDVNTGKFVGKGASNLEETVTRNNLEAAEEVVRQLRLRDIGGIIVIDFIDMVLESNRDLVLRRLTECLGRDRTKHQVAEVTSLGLVQMTRKRIGQGLLEAFSEPCEVCNGRGVVIHMEPLHQKPSGGATAESKPERRGRSGRKDKPDDEAERAAEAARAAERARVAAQIAAASAHAHVPADADVDAGSPNGLVIAAEEDGESAVFDDVVDGSAATEVEVEGGGPSQALFDASELTDRADEFERFELADGDDNGTAEADPAAQVDSSGESGESDESGTSGKPAKPAKAAKRAKAPAKPRRSGAKKAQPVAVAAQEASS